MASWLAAQYNGVLILDTSTFFVPFVASFGSHGKPVWHHLGPRATPFGALGTHGGPGPKVAKLKGPKSQNLDFFGIPFWTHFRPKAVKFVLRGYLGTGLAKMLSTGAYLDPSSP